LELIPRRQHEIFAGLAGVSLRPEFLVKIPVNFFSAGKVRRGRVYLGNSSTGRSSGRLQMDSGPLQLGSALALIIVEAGGGNNIAILDIVNVDVLRA